MQGWDAIHFDWIAENCNGLGLWISQLQSIGIAIFDLQSIGIVDFSIAIDLDCNS